MVRAAKDRKWGAIKSFLSDVLGRPDEYPDDLAVFVLTDHELHQVFTKERLRILRTLREGAFESVTELSGELSRDKAAVDRDLKLLEKYGLVRMVRQGRRVRPELGKEGVYLPLVEPKPIDGVLAGDRRGEYVGKKGKGS